MNLVGGVASPPKRPTGLKVSVASWQRLDLKWTDNADNENGFDIQRSTGGADGPWNQIHQNNANDKGYSVTGLKGNTKYWFRIRAYNGNGNSDWSGVEADTTFNQYPPDAPTGLTAVASNDDRVSLNWTDNANNEDGFKIQQSSEGTTFTEVDTTGANVTSRVITGLRPNRAYHFRVKAYNTAGSSAWSNVATDTTGPAAPTNLIAKKGGHWDEADLTWDDNSSSENGFKVERATSSSGPWTQVGTTSAGTADYTDTGLAGTTTYYFRVRSYNANANSVFSNTDSMTTGNSPAVLSAIGNKTVASGQPLIFTAAATDPNQVITTTTIAGFQGANYNNVPTVDGEVMFRPPRHSASFRHDQFFH